MLILTLKSQLSNNNFFIPLFSEPKTIAFFFKSFGTVVISLFDLCLIQQSRNYFLKIQ